MRLIEQNKAVFERIYDWTLDEEISTALGFPIVEMSSENFINCFKDKYDGFNNYIIGVVDDKYNFAGCFFVESFEKHKRAKVDFAFNDYARGTILYKALSSFYKYMFYERGYNTLTGEISVYNERSLKCALKTGWQFYCRLPEYLNIKGEQVDANLVILHKGKEKI